MTDAILNVASVGVIFFVIWILGFTMAIRPQTAIKDVEKIIVQLADLMSDILKHHDKDKKG